MKLVSAEDRARLASQMRRAVPVRLCTPRIAPPKFPLDNDLRYYIKLACNHWTTREEQVRVSVWRPAKDKYWCDGCNKWVKLMPKPKAAPMPEEPLF